MVSDVYVQLNGMVTDASLRGMNADYSCVKMEQHAL